MKRAAIIALCVVAVWIIVLVVLDVALTGTERVTSRSASGESLQATATGRR